MRYIVLDLEWNQPKNPREAVLCGANRKLEGEVIQMGAVVMNDEKQIERELRILIKPQFYRKMSKRISDLTGITDEMLVSGVSLAEAMAQLRALTEDQPAAFFSWGMDDLRVLKQNFQMLEMDAEWLSPWYNLQLIFGIQTGMGKQQKALTSAMEMFELSVDRPAHDALNDAYFAALIAQKLDMVKGLAEYPSEGKRKKNVTQHRHRGRRGGRPPRAMQVPVKPSKQ